MTLDMAAIRERASSDVRWCAEVGVPPSQDSRDRRELLAEVDRLREMIDGQAWEDLHAEVVQLRHDVSILEDERDFLRGRDERSLEQDGADTDDEPQGTADVDLAAALQASLDELQARRRAERQPDDHG